MCIFTKNDKVYKLFVRESSYAPDDFELNDKGNYQKFVTRFFSKKNYF